MTKSQGKRKFIEKSPFLFRFWERVDRKDENSCWEWKGKLSSKGYGRIGYKGENIQSHRASWMVHFGGIPVGLHVLHRCDNRKCVNPSHLFLGTNDDNIADMVSKGRNSRGENSSASKLTEQDVRVIRFLYDELGIKIYILKELFGVCDSVICNVVHRKAWKHVL